VRDCSEFYQERDLRTTEYMRSQYFEILPVHVAIDAEAAREPPGQIALLALANQLARVHRCITFDVPSTPMPLLVPVPFARPTLDETLVHTCGRIDPCGDFRVGRPQPGRVVSIALGNDPQGEYEWYLGADQAVAHLGRHPVGFSSKAATVRGAGLASCLGAAAVFRSMVGLQTTPRSISAWNYAEGNEASLGPESLAPLDVGRGLIVGAGAVASSLVYWLHAFGVRGVWTVVDRDVVHIHNLNRGLLFEASDAGWPEGELKGKAGILASWLPNGIHDSSWYHESKLVNEHYDVVLGLANDHNVRHFIASRNNTVTLHATTGDNWLSQLHRHIAGVDDCIWCRAGEVTSATFRCSTGTIESAAGTTTDAALPFLSAASGLMLATALQRLECEEFARENRNDWRWDFGSTYKMATSGFRQCRSDCTRILAVELRRKMDGQSRWLALGK
jgi:hypothetical protein